MDRRGFLKLLPVAVGGIALAEAIPMGRVWSFPKEIRTQQLSSVHFHWDEYERLIKMGKLEVGSVVPVRIPQRFDVLWGFGRLQPENVLVEVTPQFP